MDDIFKFVVLKKLGRCIICSGIKELVGSVCADCYKEVRALTMSLDRQNMEYRSLRDDCIKHALSLPQVERVEFLRKEVREFDTELYVDVVDFLMSVA